MASSARQMSRAVASVRSAFFRRRDLVLSFMMPHMRRSLIRPSVSVPNSHVLALVRRSVTYSSMDSPVFCLRVLKTCLSQVMFFARNAIGFEFF